MDHSAALKAYSLAFQVLISGAMDCLRVFLRDEFCMIRGFHYP